MVDYLKTHTKYVEDVLDKNGSDFDWKKLSKLHERKIKYLQHERLIHLLVTLFVALFTLLTIFFTVSSGKFIFGLIALMFIALLVPYLFHYRSLENGVQRLYELSEQISRRC